MLASRLALCQSWPSACFVFAYVPLCLLCLANAETDAVDTAPKRDCQCWAAQGQCSDNPRFMARQCSASCALHNKREKTMEVASSLQARVAELELALQNKPDIAKAGEAESEVADVRLRLSEALERASACEAQSASESRNESEALHGELSALRLRVDELQAQLDQAGEREDNLSQTLASQARRDSEISRDEVTSLRTRVEQLQVQLVEAGERESKLSQELASQAHNDSEASQARNDTEVSHDELATLRTRVGELRLQLAEAGEREKQLSQEFASQAAWFPSQLTGLQARVEELQVQLAKVLLPPQAFTTSETSHEEMTTLRTRVSELQAQLGEAVEREDKMSRALAVSEATLASLRAEGSEADVEGTARPSSATTSEGDEWAALYESIFNLPETLRNASVSLAYALQNTASDIVVTTRAATSEGKVVAQRWASDTATVCGTAMTNSALATQRYVLDTKTAWTIAVMDWHSFLDQLARRSGVSALNGLQSLQHDVTAGVSNAREAVLQRARTAKAVGVTATMADLAVEMQTKLSLFLWRPCVHHEKSIFVNGSQMLEALPDGDGLSSPLPAACPPSSAVYVELPFDGNDVSTALAAVVAALLLIGLTSPFLARCIRNRREEPQEVQAQTSPSPSTRRRCRRSQQEARTLQVLRDASDVQSAIVATSAPTPTRFGPCRLACVACLLCGGPYHLDACFSRADTLCTIFQGLLNVAYPHLQAIHLTLEPLVSKCIFRMHLFAEEIARIAPSVSSWALPHCMEQYRASLIRQWQVVAASEGADIGKALAACLVIACLRWLARRATANRKTLSKSADCDHESATTTTTYSWQPMPRIPTPPPRLTMSLATRTPLGQGVLEAPSLRVREAPEYTPEVSDRMAGSAPVLAATTPERDTAVLAEERAHEAGSGPVLAATTPDRDTAVLAQERDHKEEPVPVLAATTAVRDSVSPTEDRACTARRQDTVNARTRPPPLLSLGADSDDEERERSAVRRTRNAEFAERPRSVPRSRCGAAACGACAAVCLSLLCLTACLAYAVITSDREHHSQHWQRLVAWWASTGDRFELGSGTLDRTRWKHADF